MRKSLTKKERAVMRDAQGNICACGCDRALGENFIAEHIWAVAMGNTSKPDALYRFDCAQAKTKMDVRLIAKTKRQSGKITGQQARRARRKEEGREPLIRGAGFQKRLRKRMDGRVEVRT